MLGLTLLITAFINTVLLTPKVFASEFSSVKVTEFMVDPTAVSDANGEWIELENKSSESVDLTGWDINGSVISGGVALKPGARAVICKNTNTAENGNVKCHAKSNFSLAQTGGVTRSIQLKNQSDDVVDEITYVGNQDVVAGKSTYALSSGQFFKESTYKYNQSDYGTPDKNKLLNTNLTVINVHSTTDMNKNGKMDYSGEAGHQNAGRIIRLYDSQWNVAPFGENGSNEVVTTLKNSLPRAARFRVPIGSYFLCQISKVGTSPSFVASVTSWVTWKNNGVANNSGNEDEDETCIAVNGSVAGKQSMHKFGSSIDSEPAFGQIYITTVIDYDGDGEPDWNDQEKHQAGWQIRLYDADWSYIKVTATSSAPFFPAWFSVTPGSYYVCPVMKEGYSQSFARTITSWTSWPNSGVQNQSTVNDEGSECIQTEVFSGSTHSHVFGNAPLLP